MNSTQVALFKSNPIVAFITPLSSALGTLVQDVNPPIQARSWVQSEWNDQLNWISQAPGTDVGSSYVAQDSWLVAYFPGLPDLQAQISAAVSAPGGLPAWMRKYISGLAYPRIDDGPKDIYNGVPAAANDSCPPFPEDPWSGSDGGDSGYGGSDPPSKQKRQACSQPKLTSSPTATASTGIETITIGIETITIEIGTTGHETITIGAETMTIDIGTTGTSSHSTRLKPTSSPSPSPTPNPSSKSCIEC